MAPHRSVLVASLAALVGAGVALSVHHVVRAAGAPTMSPLLYRGYLEDGGRPVDGARSIGASLHSAETAGMEHCAFPPRMVTVTAGRFELPLDACVAAVRERPDVWLQLTVGGTPFPRTKLGAVPYALEADRASAAAGALQTQIADMQSRLTALQARVAAAESRDADCPRGYTASPDPSFTGEQRLCVRGADQVVRVGTGNEAFWIDRWEASVWQTPDGTGAQYGIASDDYPMGFPDNGQWTTRVYALSKPSVRPSASLTWFQANEACRASGKRLPTGDEWLSAARNTPDTTTNCRIERGALGDRSRDTNAETGCRSAWGAEDMIGNVWEWAAEWYAGAGNGVPPGAFVTGGPTAPWPSGFGDDGTWNVNAFVSAGTSNARGMPSAAFRGGAWDLGTLAGAYSLDLSHGPSSWRASVGFRCVLRR